MSELTLALAHLPLTTYPGPGQAPKLSPARASTGNVLEHTRCQQGTGRGAVAYENSSAKVEKRDSLFRMK